MLESIQKHEWDNRLGLVGYNLQNQAKSLRDFINMFENDMSEPDRTALRRIAHDVDDLSKDIALVEKRRDEVPNGKNI
jgi:hypothetical protein